MSDADRIQEGRPAAEELPAGKLLREEEYRHPARADVVRLLLYQQPRGFLVTQERETTSRVVATLGFLPARGDAEALLRARAHQLELQQFTRLTVEQGEGVQRQPSGAGAT